MKAFPRLSMLYESWKSFVEEKGQGSIKVVLEREVTGIKRHSRSRGAIEVWSRPTKGTNNQQEVVDPGEEDVETFDEIVFCTDADAALKILGDDAGWLEKRILGNVKVRCAVLYNTMLNSTYKYLWDVTVTHNDLKYMEQVT
jgi:hypothetical protein